MKFIVIFLTLMGLSLPSQASLLDRVQLEESLRGRVENLIKVFDRDAKVIMNFSYQSYSNTLPGTTVVDNTSSLTPMRLEAADLRNITVEIYTEMSEIPAEARDLIFKLLPVDRSRVTLKLDRLKAAPLDIPQPLDPKSLTDIFHQSVIFAGQILAGLLGACLLLLVLFHSYTNRRTLKEFRNQISSLNQTLADLSLGGNAGPTMAPVARQTPSSADPSSRKDWSQLPSHTLSEIFADCYWCEEDGYAHWLWKQLPTEAKAKLLQELSFMRDYSLSFMNTEAEQAFHHEHPCYLDPMNLVKISQADLSKIVRDELSLWHSLSPMRQQNLPLSLQDKLTALQSSPSAKKKAAWAVVSAPRVLEYKPTWGEISETEELAIFENPSLVPEELRTHVKSLAWLAHRDPEFVRETLSKYDARTLASVWSAPAPILEKLEACLPEKKLKLMKNYAGKSIIDRQSPVFESLVEEGLRHAA